MPRLNTDEETGGDSHSGSTDTNLSIVDTGSDAAREALTMVMGTDEGRVFPINLTDTWIGRADDCEIIVADRGVSRHHASIIHEGSSVFVKDNDAKNGTFVNNRRISKVELQAGDEIQLGPNVCLVFSHEKVARQRAVRDKALAARIRDEQVESIRRMVAGVAHEINTPLGVASAANAMIEALAEEVRRNPGSERIDELLADLKASTGLLGKNLERASTLVRTFKQLSARDSLDERADCDLAEVVRDCIEIVKLESRAHDVTIAKGWEDGARFPWVGFQGSLTRVLSSLIQNSIIHGYPNRENGTVEVRITRRRNHYHIEVEDSGVGMDPAIVARVFEPFVMAGRDKGGIGLGLAIVHNIVTNVLGGAITFTSQRGKGTRFLLKLPIEVPLDLDPGPPSE